MLVLADSPAEPPVVDHLLQTLLDVSLTGVIMFRPVYAPGVGGEFIDLEYEYLNPTGQRMLALPECPPNTFLTIYPHAHETGVFDFFRTTFESGQPGRLDINYQHDGLDNFFHLAALRSGERLVVSFTDTADHDRSLVEQALRVSQAREQADQAETQRDYFQRIFEQAPVAIAVLRGPQYVIEQANPAVCALWGRTPGQALHTPLFVLLPEAAGQGFEELLNGVMFTGEPYVATELPSVINRNNHLETVYWNFVYQPLRDAQGLIAGVTVVAIDVSEQVAARQQLQEINEELRASNQQLMRTNVDLDNFIYTASHDLKAPIANIEGLLHALLAELPAASQQAVAVAPLLDMIQLSVERFQATITQLTTLSQLQEAHAQPTETVYLAAVVDDVRFDLNPLLTASSTELTVDVDTLSIISFSAKNLRSLVYNLLSNAVKYRAPDRPSVVSLRCHRVGAVMVLEVQDNGMGLTPAQQSRLFGMFQRLHTHVEGSGIGLYMVKKIVENAGGTVRVQSQAGVGSTFTITFPG